MSERVRTVSIFLRNPEGRVISHLRDDKPGLPFPSHWSTLGGSIEDGETPDEAARRELAEEIELCPPLHFWRLFEHHFLLGEQVRYVDIYAYVGEIQETVADIHLREGQKLAFLSRKDIDRLPFAYELDHLYRAYFRDYGDLAKGQL